MAWWIIFLIGMVTGIFLTWLARHSIAEAEAEIRRVAALTPEQRAGDRRLEDLIEEMEAEAESEAALAMLNGYIIGKM